MKLKSPQDFTDTLHKTFGCANVIKYAGVQKRRHKFKSYSKLS